MSTVIPGRRHRSGSAPSHRARTAVLLLGLVAAAVVLGGCGDDEGDPGEATPTTSAVQGPRAPGTVGSARELSERMTAAARREGTVSVRVDPQGGTGTSSAGGLRLKGETPEFTMSLENADNPLTMVAVSEGVFLRLPEELDGNRWLKLTSTLDDIKGDDTFSEIYAEVVDSIRSNIDVVRLAAGFELASSFRAQGPETVNGAATTKYTITLGEEALRAQLSPHAQGKVGEQLAGATATVDVFVDAEGLPRQIITSTQADGRTLTSTVTYWAWGEKVSIKTPPSKDVAKVADYPDTSQLTRRLQRQLQQSQP